MPSSDVNAATPLTEASWRRDKILSKTGEIYHILVTMDKRQEGFRQFQNIYLRIFAEFIRCNNAFVLCLSRPFVSLIVLTEGFLRYLRAMLGDA